MDPLNRSINPILPCLVSFLFLSFTISKLLVVRPPAALSSSQYFTAEEGLEYDITGLALESPKVLLGRDICTDALPGTISSQCTPSNTSVTTLCCVRPDSDYPQCAIYERVGFCLVSATPSAHNAYTDTASVCDTAPNPVFCKTSDNSRACCPEHTNCPAGNVTASQIRCTGNSSVLAGLAAVSKATTSISSITSTYSTPLVSLTLESTSTPVQTSNPSTVAQNSLSSSKSSTISGGIIAGIIVGAIAALGVAITATWFLARRRQRRIIGYNVPHGRDWNRDHSEEKNDLPEQASGMYPRCELPGDADGASSFRTTNDGPKLIAELPDRQSRTELPA